MINGVLNKDLEFELKWTKETWEDGVPVTKYMFRCDAELPVDLAEGDTLSGMRTYGRLSGCEVFYFKVGRIWYYTEKYEADELLEALGVEDVGKKW